MRSDERAKQKDASNTKGTVGSKGRNIPTIPNANAMNPATSSRLRLIGVSIFYLPLRSGPLPKQ